MILDELDTQLLHALQIDGRAPYSRIAEVLGVSARTIARRYGRMRADGLVRVVGERAADFGGAAEWIVRITVHPGTADTLMRWLVARPDTSWVVVSGGGTEISCVLRVFEGGTTAAEVFGKRPEVTGITAHRLLRTFMRGHWRGRTSVLTPAQIDRLRPVTTSATAVEATNELDSLVFAALAVDGRTRYPDLAHNLRWSESVIRRRMEELRRAGMLGFRVEIEPAAYGFTVSCAIWMTVVPQRMQAVATALAADDQAAFVAAVTGSRNLLVIVVFRDTAELYTYLAERIAAVEGIESLETTPVDRYAKRIAKPLP